MNYCFGVDIGGTTVKIGLFEETGTIVEKWEIPTNTLADGEAILPDIAFSLKTKIEERKLSEEDILGIGVGVPAPVTAEGIVNGSANLGWKYKEVKKLVLAAPAFEFCNFKNNKINFIDSIKLIPRRSRRKKYDHGNAWHRSRRRSDH